MALTDFELLVNTKVQSDTGNSLSLKGAVADGASAVGVIVDNIVALANASSKLLSVRNLGAERSYLDLNGLFNGGVNAVGGVSSSALATPVNGTHTTATTGGSLVPGTYWYRVSATNAIGQTLASTETSKVVPAGTNTNTVTAVWGVVAGATGYKVYGRTTGAELLMATITNGNTVSWLDDGSVGPAGALPTANSTGALVVTGTAADTAAITIPAQSRIVMDGSGSKYIRANAGNYFNPVGFDAIEFLGGLYYGNQISSAAATGFNILGKDASDGSAKALVIGNHTALTTAGDKILSLCSDTGATEKAYVDKDGNYITSGDISALLYGKPTWVGTVVTAAGSPVDNTTTASSFTLTAGAVYFCQPDVSCYLEVVAAAFMTLAGAKSVTLQALQMYYFQVKTGSLKYSFDVAAGGANIKFFQMS